MSKTTRLLSTSAYGGVEYGNQLVEDAKALLAMLGLEAS